VPLAVFLFFERGGVNMSGQSVHQQNTILESEQQNNNIQKGDIKNDKIKISRQFCPDILRVGL
jgi:hypothetical protein